MADKDLFTRLKRLFSSNVIVRNVGGKKLRVIDTDAMQSFVSNAMRDRYSRLYSSNNGAAGNNQNYMNAVFQAQRLMFFRDYDAMDRDPILSSALDIYMEESTLKNEFGKMLTIHSDSAEIKEILDNLFYDVLNIEYNLPWWIRSMCKYGDMFLFLEITEKYGIKNVMPLSSYDTFRYEGLNPDNPYEVVFDTMASTGRAQRLQNYEVAHFRLMSDGNFLPYGKSSLEAARRIWRQLTLMEDAMLIHRIMRAPDKRVFKIDVGNIPPHEVENHITNIINKTKKVPFIDERSGDYNVNYNMQNIQEDFYLPVRGSDSGTSIESLGGLQYNAIEDIEYLRNKLMAALKIPKAFFGYEESLSGKTTLAAEDVRFARTIERIQKIVVSELTKIAVIHLYAQGHTDEQLVNFSLSFAGPSTIYEQEKLNLWREKIGLAQDAINSKMLSREWVYDNIFHMASDDIKKEQQKIVQDVKTTFRFNQMEQGMSDPVKFGFPQDQEQPDPMAGGGGMDPGAMGGAPPGGAPPEGPPANETAQPGRPKEGPKYGQDSHVRGRDPLGQHGRKALDAEEPRNRIKSPLSIESVLNENTDAGTYLDDVVLDSTFEL